VKFTLVSGTEIKKPARKVTQFNRGLWSASPDNPISFAPGEGIPESAASRNEDEGRLFSYLCDGVCEKGQTVRDLVLLWRVKSKKFYCVVWAETAFRGMMCRTIKYKFIAHSIKGYRFFLRDSIVFKIIVLRNATPCRHIRTQLSMKINLFMEDAGFRTCVKVK
jgi:hypothetical protein